MWMSDKLLKLIVSENRALKRTGSTGVWGCQRDLWRQSCYTNGGFEGQNGE